MATDFNDIGSVQDNYTKYKDMFTTEKNDLITMDSFYELLVAEMSNQDPLEPTSNTEFISQMASFTSLQAQQDNFDMQKQNYANSLVGQMVSVSLNDGSEELKTGVVNYVTYGDEITVNVDGKNYSMKSIKQVHGRADSSAMAENSSVSQIGTYGAFAAGILGKTVDVQAIDSAGSLVLDRGTASSLEIKDGMVRVVVNGMAYNVTDVVSVAQDEQTGNDESEDEESYSNAAPAAEKTETAAEENTGAVVERTDDDDIPDLVDEEQETTAIANSELYSLFGE